MPSYVVVKPSRDEDFYVYWSTVTDSPHAYGSREEIAAHIAGGEGRFAVDARLNRADKHGTSALWPDGGPPYAFGWDNDAFIYEQLGTLTRSGLRELCRRYETTADPDVSDLLTPFEDVSW